MNQTFEYVRGSLATSAATSVSNSTFKPQRKHCRRESPILKAHTHNYLHDRLSIVIVGVCCHDPSLMNKSRWQTLASQEYIEQIQWWYKVIQPKLRVVFF